MRYETLTEYDEFVELRNEWNLLLSKSKANTIFLRWEWLDAWWHAYRTTEMLQIIIFRNEADELVGIAPFVSNCIPTGLLIKAKALYFMGIRFDRKLTEYMDLIVESDHEDEICSELVRIINKQLDWDILIFPEVPENSNCLAKICSLMDPFQFLFTKSSHGCSVVEIPGDFDSFLKRLKPRMRTKLRSLPRKLKEKYDVEMIISESEIGLDPVLNSFYELHQKRWESDDQPGSFKSSDETVFYDKITKSFLEKNILRIYSLKIDGEYRAHEYGFLYNNKLFVLQEGFDPDWLKNGVGNVLRTMIINHCIDNEIEEYDFLGGVTYHKNSWGVHVKNSVSYTFGKRNPKAMAYFYRPVIIEKIKNFYRSIMPQKLVQWRIDWYNERKAIKVRKSLASEKQ